MSQPFVGEIRMFGGNFAPVGWAFCDGALLPIADNDVLFTLIGTTYGGDGQTTFALPDLRGRIPVHAGTLGGSQFTLGESGGTEDVTLTVQQIPIHSHAALSVAGAGNQASPANSIWAGTQSGTQIYADPPNATGAEVPMKVNNIAGTGGSQPHTNMAPFLVISFIISLFGVTPN
jgi:microcystin-dependent protein